MATHSSVLAWRIPGTGEPGGLRSMGQLKEGFDADLVIFDDQIQIKSVIIGGQIKI